MTEIWNLSSICRCCHKEGELKALDRTYFHFGNVVVYSQLLYDTFGLMISPPPCSASHAICLECAQEVVRAAAFKVRAVDCEKRFQEYCTNKFQPPSVKTEVLSDTSDNETAEILSHHSNNDLDEKPDLTEATEIAYTKSDADEARIERDAMERDINEESNTEVNENTDRGALPRTTTNNFSERETSERSESRKNEKDPPEITSTKKVICCKICSATFKNSTQLNSHKRIAHLKFRCSHCSLLFPSIKKKEVHIKEKHDYKCVDCSRHFLSEKTLDRHYAAQHSRNSSDKQSTFQWSKVRPV